MAIKGLLHFVIIFIYLLQKSPTATCVPWPAHMNQTANRHNTRNSERQDPDNESLTIRERANSFSEPTPSSKHFHGFYSNVADYPKDKIARILKNTPVAAGYFDTEFVDVGITNRFNSDEMPLCESTTETFFPQKGKNTEQKEVYIINDDKHKQGFVSETCVGSTTDGKRGNSACNFADTFPIGYTAQCKQKFVMKKMLVAGTDKATYDTFPVPSCCVCTVTKT